MKAVHTTDMSPKFTFGEILQIWPWRQSHSHTKAGRHRERDMIKEKTNLSLWGAAVPQTF